MQFHAQTSHYNEHFSLASFNLIVLEPVQDLTLRVPSNGLKDGM
jgi:hypothetical protein